FLRKELQDEVEDAEKQLEERGDLDKAAKLVCLTTIDDNNAKLATLTAKKDVMDESMMEEYDTVDKIQTLELQLVGMLQVSMQYSYGLDILEIAFTQTDYIGDASIEFNDYVLKCWEKYCKNPSVFEAPCVAVVQSSGFGKSRMLYELARMSLAQLENIYYHALVNWKDVQTEWLNLFTSTEADVDVHKKLSMAIETKMKAHVTKKWSKKVVVLVIDEARSLLAERKHRDTNSKVSDLTPPLSQDPSSRNMLGTPVLASFPPFVLTHTMDILWQEHYTNNHSGDGEVISEKMQDDIVMKVEDEEMDDENASGGGEVATDKEKVLEASRATYKAEQKKLMATVAAYKAAVTGDQTVAWEAILAMGRPLLGARPYSTSALASRLVADFMAILAYVDYEKEGYCGMLRRMS
ncbi:Hypothetical protein PHPALM_10859, partial [Phytophthora palmivora]